MIGSSIEPFVKVSRARNNEGDARTTVAIIHGADLKQFGGTLAEVIPTITSTHYKDAPCVFTEEG